MFIEKSKIMSFVFISSLYFLVFWGPPYLFQSLGADVHCMRILPATPYYPTKCSKFLKFKILNIETNCVIRLLPNIRNYVIIHSFNLDLIKK